MSTLSVPLITDEDDTLSAALKYAEAGWFLVPLQKATKHPGSVLGDDWNHQSSRDTETIVSWLSGTDYGIALHAGRSGAVVIDVDDPEKLDPDVTTALVESGAPFQSTRPGTMRGHWIYRTDVPYSNSSAGLGPGLDVRGKSGIIVVAPSIHEKHASGHAYEWLQTGEVPEVPGFVSAHLRASQNAEDAATDAEVARFLAEHTSNESPGILAAVLRRFEDETGRGESRHPSAVSCAVQIAREAVARKYSAGDAFDALESLFVESVTKGPDARCSVPQARSEYQGIVAWAVAQAKDRDPDELREQIDARTRVNLKTLDPSFWDQRESLRHIRDAAWSREASPEAVLGLTLARLSGMQSAKLDIGKGPTGLNLFTAAIGPSGAGKSVASQAAQDLIPARLAQDFLDALPVGSGEGLAEAYMGQVPIDPADPKKTKRGQVRQYAYVYIDEGQVLDQLTERQGSTLAMNLRQAFSCSTLGQQNASEDRTRIVTSYSLGLGIAFQPPMIRKLFADVDGGTPQRFLLTDAVARDLPDDDVPWPGPLCPEDAPEMWPTHVTGLVGFDLPDVKAELRAKRRAVRRGDVDQDPFDAHADLIRARVAALLAILDGRASVHRDDWRIAGQVMAQSTTLRDQLRGEHVAEDQAREQHATEQAASRAAALSNHDRKLNRVARLLVKHATEGMTRSQLLHKLHSRDHGHFEAALPRAMDDGGFEFDDEDRVRF